CLLPETDDYGAKLTASRIRENIESLKLPHPSSQICDVVTVSLGVSTVIASDDINKNILLLSADRALYQAKSEGRNRFVFLSKETMTTESGSQVCRRQIEDKNLKELLVSFTEENPNPVICLRRNGTILYGNSTAKNFFAEWCSDVGTVLPESFMCLTIEKEERFNLELPYKDKIYDFTIVPLAGRDVLFITADDITHKKLVEGELNKLKRVIDESINIVFITDYEGNIEYVNSTFEKITGFSKDEAIGKNPRILASGETSQANYKNLWTTIKSGKTWRGVFKNKKKNGELYWANGFISPIRNEKSEITHFMAIQEDITDKMLAESKLQYLSSYDPVTSIINRARFVELLTELIAKQEVKSGCLIIVNIDAFKLINDSYGHSIGDQFLKQFAEFLKGFVVELDIVAKPEINSIVGRLGGDEFALFLAERDEKQALIIVEDLRQRIEKTRFLNEMIRVTASIGISLYPEQSQGVSDLLTKANAAVIKAKELGQNRWYLYQENDTYLKTAQSSLEEKQRIITAMEEDRFVPYFQPILDLKTNSIHHYEALARLIAPDDTVMLPSSFIFTAERYGLISGIDKIITYKTMLIQAELRRLGRIVSFSINLSGKHLGDESMLKYLKESLDDTKAQPENIVFELTETAAIQDFTAAVRFVKELKSMGCKFSLDDFGVGFTSFVHIIEMEVDFIKIDGSFVRNISLSKRNRLLVKTIADLARGLNIKTIAEFADTEETLSILRELGVDYAQGYFIGKPAPHLL
ncbi:MAG: EAL domain-containing protein, partial [Thermodesulfovibrionales bacterium]|nr:EAL domain-containing protein [Thermodesulfovibrionales bacterium]